MSNNLVSETGRDYFYDRFGGSYFYGPDNVVCMIDANARNRSDTSIIVQRLEGVKERVRKVRAEVPNDFFQDMSFLRAPPLGWRTAAKGKVLAYFSRNNHSYARGYNTKNVSPTWASHSEFLQRYGNLNLAYFSQDEAKGKLVMEPEYMSLSAGLQEMNAGRIVAFAVNPDVAVIPESEETYALLGRMGQVGSVNAETGAITMTVPFDSNYLLESE